MFLRKLTFVLMMALLAPASLFAAADLVISVIGSGDAEVVLVSPNGTETKTQDDGDGTLILKVPGRGGEYEVRITANGQTATSSVTVPSSGQLALVFDPAAEEKIQVAYSAGNEEIYVTARRREENLQQTPISIAAFTSETLEERNIKDLSDLSDFTPNLDFATTSVLGGATDTAVVYIRGIGQITENIWADPGVGIYIDGVYLARAQGAVLDLVDTERVEVLRGPQGTLFGKNTIGGALSIVTRKPDSAFDGMAEIQAGSFDRLNGALRVSGGLSDSLFGSLAVASKNADGFTRSLQTGEEYADDNTDSARIALRWQASESTTIDWSVDDTRSRERAADVTLIGFSQTPLLEFYNAAQLAAGLEPYDERWITGSLRESYSDVENFARSDISGTALDASWLLGTDLALRSISAYRELDISESNDFDGSPKSVSMLPTARTQEQWSQEIQLSGVGADDRLNWVLGGIYFEEEANATQAGVIFGDLFGALEAAPGAIVAPPGAPQFLCNPGPPPPGVPCFGGAGNPLNLAFFPGRETNVSDPSTTSWAIFGEGNYSVNDRLTVTAGLRYTLEEKDFLFQQFSVDGALITLERRNEDWNVWTPRISFAYQTTPESMLYFSVAKGFKSGGFSGLFGDNSSFLEPFEPEEVWTYELGVKADFLDNRIRLNTAFFFSDYTNLQLTASLVENGQPVFVVQNAEQAEIQGFESELQAQLSDNFRLNVGIGYTDASYKELDSSFGIPEDGTIPRTPEWNVVLSPEYSVDIDGGSLLLRADYSYRSEFFNDIANTQGIIQEGYDLINARASYILPSGAWEIFAFGTNLTDEEYKEHALFPAAFGPFLAIAGRPQEWGAGFKYRF